MILLTLKYRPKSEEYRIGWVEDDDDIEARAYYTDDIGDLVDTIGVILDRALENEVDIWMSEDTQTQQLQDKCLRWVAEST